METWQSTYKGIIPEDYLQSLTIENRLKNWQRHLKTLHTATFIAENEAGAVIGFAIGGPEQTSHPLYHAEIYAIYILDTYQRNGIGKQLIKHYSQIIRRKKISKYDYLGIGGKFKSFILSIIRWSNSGLKKHFN